MGHLTGRIRPRPRLPAMPKDDFADLISRHTGALKRGARGDSTEFSGMHVAEGASVATDRRPSRT